MSKKYIKKIEINSEEWKLYKDKNFDRNFYIDKEYRGKNYKYFYLNQQNRNIFNIDNDDLSKLENIDYCILKDYQKEALHHILKNRKVILNLPVRFGKTYLAVTTILNNKKNSIIFVDPCMIEIFKNVFYEHNEKNVSIYYKDENSDVFNNLNNLEHKIIITTEETFISRYVNNKINEKGIKNLNLIENIVIDEYHNFIKKADKRYKDFKNIINKHFKNIDIFILMSATPTSEYIYNIFYAIQLLDKDFIVTDWLNKSSEAKIDIYKNYTREIKNEKCLKGIINDALYTWKEMDPFCTLKIKEILLEHDKNMYSLASKEKNNIRKQKIFDDHRLSKFKIDEYLPKKIEKAISIIEENKNKKIVIFTYFKKSQNNIKNDLKKINVDSKYINSDISTKNRLEIINEFQKNDLNVVIVEIKAAIGITLDKADMAIMICDEYEPQKYYQALGRIISTDFYNPEFKCVHWIYDKFFNSKEKIEQKLNVLESFGINYSPFKEKDIWVYLESYSDMKFIEKFTSIYPKFKLFNRNKTKFNPNILIAYEQIGLNYIFICDNDKILKDYKLEEKKLKYITYNELFGVDKENKNIEDVLLSLNYYKKWQIDVIENCNEKINPNYKSFIYSFENIKDINDKAAIDRLINFLEPLLDKNDYVNIVNDLYFYIKRAILFNSNKSYYFKNVKSIIKSYFMSKIDNTFIEKYSEVFICNLEDKLNNYKIRDCVKNIK